MKIFKNFPLLDDIKGLLIVSLLFVFLVFCGTLGYYFLGGENYTLFDAFYMTVITISTVGYEEVYPLNQAGRILTIILIFSSLILLGFLASIVSRFILEGILKKSLKSYKMNNKIAKLHGHIIICGYGRNGKQAARELKEHEKEVVIIDNDERICEKMHIEDKHLYVLGDATEDNVLKIAKIETAIALIATIPNDAENMFIVITARQLNPDLKIISRCSNIASEVKLRHAGADNVIMPDLIGGQKMAKLVIEPDIVEFLDYILLQSHKNVSLEEISCKDMNEKLIGKPIQELGVRDRSGANIIGLKLGNGQYIFNPDPTTPLLTDNQLFILGNPKQIANLRSILK